MSRDRRRILLVTPWLPDPPFWGSAIRVRELVRQLSKRHSVTMVSYVHPWEEENVRVAASMCDSLHVVPAPWPRGGDWMGRGRSIFSAQPYALSRLASPALQATVDELLARETYDLVQVASSQMSGLDLSQARTCILDEHNIEYELLARGLQVETSLPRRVFNSIELGKLRRAEQDAWRRYDGCVVTSDRELAELEAVVPDKPLAVIPNGVDLDYFAPQPDTGCSGLVFSGLMSYRPNVDAVTHFVQDILPLVHRSRPEVTFTMVGWGVTDEVRALLGPRVISTGKVADVRPYLARAAVVVTPIRVGSGTRLKVLESLAMARPLVSTSVACEGLDLTSGGQLIIEDDPARFAAAVLRLLDDRALAERLGSAGRRTMEANYGWDASGQRLEEFHERVLATGSRQPELDLRAELSQR